MLFYLGIGFIFLGVLAFSVSAFGLFRMPDVFTRMQVATKSTTMGTVLVLIGAALIEPTWSLKLFLLALFILLTNPLSSSVLARAMQREKK